MEDWDAICRAEDEVYRKTWPDLVSAGTLEAFYTGRGAVSVETRILETLQSRLLGEKQLSDWLDGSRRGSLGEGMEAFLGPRVMARYRDYCREKLRDRRVEWKSVRCLCRLVV